MFWGLIMEPNKRYTQEVEKAFHISQAALDVSSTDGDPVQVMVTFEKRNYLIGTLQKGRVIQVPLDLNFDTGEKISFTSNGNSHVHLTGYLTPDDPYDNLMDDESDEEEETEEVPKLVPVKKEKRKSESSSSPAAKKSKKSKLEDLLKVEDEEEDSEDDDFDPNNVTAATNDSEDEQLEFLSDEEAEDEEDEDDNDDANEDDDDDDDDEDEDEQEKQEKPQKPAKQPKKDKQKPSTKASPQQNGVDGPKPKKDKQQKQENKKTLSGGVVIEDLKVGGGTVATSNRKVQVYYIGRLKSNNKVFDSTQKGPGFKFGLGHGEVIKGWDVGVVGMKVGGKRRITIPPQMAYGAKGSPPVIPPNSTLVFEVELRNVH